MVKQAKQQKQKKVEEVKEAQISNYNEYVQQLNKNLNTYKKLAVKNISIDKNQVLKAIKALQQIQKQKKQDLLEDDFVYIEISLDKVPEKYSIRPVQIELPHALYSEEYKSKFCVFVKDPQRAYKDKIKNMNIPTIARVLSVQKINKKFPTYKEKHQLFYDYDLFFCDYKIYDQLREPTGKIFYERKKIPFPIDCSEVPEHLQDKYSSYQEYLNSLGNFTYFSMRNGPLYVLKVARLQMKNSETVKNVINGIFNTLPHLLKDKTVKPQHVRQISVKLSDSISLPIYCQLSQTEIKAYKKCL